MEEADFQTIAQETPPSDVFIAPSIHPNLLLSGASYTHHSPLPPTLTTSPSTPCILGIDEAGRGPVLGPMVYSTFYLPLPLHHSLLANEHHFDDSKVLTPSTRSTLMRTLCTATSSLHEVCGWAVRVISARDISAGMLRPGSYNLNAQAMDATVGLIKQTFERGVNVQEIYIDTIGKPDVYQAKLERIFPTVKITVATKADSLYPAVSAASVCAKVTRDAALEVLWRAYAGKEGEAGWGSGYPSDARCKGWLQENMDPVFGWGAECRFSWGTAKDLLEGKGKGVKVEWPEADDEEQAMRVTDFFVTKDHEGEGDGDELAGWFGRPAAEAVF